MAASDSLVLAPDVRTLETELLGILRRPPSMDRPIPRTLVVVPSGTLRRHLQGRLVEGERPAVLGVAIRTAHQVATDLLIQVDHGPTGPSALFELLARHASQDQPTLKEGLDAVRNGHGVSVSSIRDLLSAGWGQVPLDADDFAEHLTPRGLAVLRAAQKTSEDMEALGVTRRSDVLFRAAGLLDSGAGKLSADAVIIYGFADATGAMSAFLRSLRERTGARVFAEAPRAPGAAIPEAFVQRFLTRIDLPTVTQALPTSLRSDDSRRFAAFHAFGPDAEVREIAVRIRGLLDQGIRPEDVGVVARHLPPYLSAIRKHFSDLALPFSGGAIPETWTPTQRILAATLALLEKRQNGAVDLWLEATHDRVRATDLRLAFRVLGATTLAAVGSLDLNARLGDRDLPLPIRAGTVRSGDAAELEAQDDDQVDDRPSDLAPLAQTVLVRQSVKRDVLQRAIAAMNRTRVALETWPEQAEASVHAQHLAAFVQTLDEVSSPPEEAFARARLQRRQAMETLATYHVPGMNISDHDAVLLLVPLLTVDPEPLGGRGGGVRVLDVSGARGLTFDHLFIMGLNADSFPRAITEDPLLPDRDRRELAAVLPDLSTSDHAHLEERHLFAALLGSANAVTWSWQRADHEGRERAPSPFVVRWLPADVTPARVQQREDQLDPRVDPTPTAAARTLALQGLRGPLGTVLPSALAEGAASSVADGDAWSGIAAYRMGVLGALDPDPRHKPDRRWLHSPHPWFGHLGPIRPSEADPRDHLTWITGLESTATCPWRTFLQRDLRLDPNPDPLSGPPALDARLIGNVVHEALERLVKDALSRDEHPMLAPSAEAMEIATQEAAASCGVTAGLMLPGLHQAIAAIALAFVARAVQHDWKDGATVDVVAAEGAGSFRLNLGTRTETIHFKSDRVDRTTDGGFRHTDYKTGKSPANLKKPEKQQEKVLEHIRRGILLQGASYAGSGPGNQGRYLYLKEDAQEIAVSWPAVEHTVLQAVANIQGARDAGVAFPRLANSKGEVPSLCSRFCEHLIACLQNDSGAKRRLEHLATEPLESESAEPFSTHLRNLWPMGRP